MPIADHIANQTVSFSLPYSNICLKIIIFHRAWNSISWLVKDSCLSVYVCPVASTTLCALTYHWSLVSTWAPLLWWRQWMVVRCSLLCLFLLIRNGLTLYHLFAFWHRSPMIGGSIATANWRLKQKFFPPVTWVVSIDCKLHPFRFPSLRFLSLVVLVIHFFQPLTLQIDRHSMYSHQVRPIAQVSLNIILIHPHFLKYSCLPYKRKSCWPILHKTCQRDYWLISQLKSCWNSTMITFGDVKQQEFKKLLKTLIIKAHSHVPWFLVNIHINVVNFLVNRKTSA